MENRMDEDLIVLDGLVVQVDWNRVQMTFPIWHVPRSFLLLKIFDLESAWLSKDSAEFIPGQLA